MTIAASYECPLAGADTGRPAAVALRLRQPSEPRAGARAGPRADRFRRGLSLALPRRTGVARHRRASRSAKAGRHSSAPLGRRAEVAFKLESQMPTGSFKDRGTRRHAEPPAGGRGRRRASMRILRAMPAPRSRLTQRLPASLPHLCAGVRAARQARADRRIRCRCPADSRHPPGRHRSGARRGRRKLSTPATTGSRFLSREPRPSPTSCGSSSAFACPTISSSRPDTAATSSASTAVSTSSRDAARSLHARACLLFRRRIAPPSRRPGRQGQTISCRSRRARPSPTASPRAKPVRVREVLGALRRSNGGVVAVAEDEIAPALAALGRLGLFVEPTAATAGAA